MLSPLNSTPAFRTSASSGAARRDAANARIESSDARSHSAGVSDPVRTTPFAAAVASMDAFAACAFASVRHASVTSYPRAASFAAPSRPMPLLLPVTTTLLRSRVVVVVVSVVVGASSAIATGVVAASADDASASAPPRTTSRRDDADAGADAASSVSARAAETAIAERRAVAIDLPAGATTRARRPRAAFARATRAWRCCDVIALVVIAAAVVVARAEL